MHEAVFLEDAAAALRRLLDDPSRKDLQVAVNVMLDLIELDPGDRRARRQAFRSGIWGSVWAIPVRGRDENWTIYWKLEEDGTPLVLHIGPEL